MEAFQNTSAPMRTNQTAPSTNGMIQNSPAVPRQLTVATPANSVSIWCQYTDTSSTNSASNRFQTLLSQHPIASLIGQLSPECKTAQDGQPTVDRHPTGSRKMKPAASKPAKGNQISSAEPVMSTGYENTSWGYVTGPYPRLPISGYPSQTQNAVPTTPLMHHQQQQGCPLVQLAQPSSVHRLKPSRLLVASVRPSGYGFSDGCWSCLWSSGSSIAYETRLQPSSSSTDASRTAWRDDVRITETSPSCRPYCREIQPAGGCGFPDPGR
ncbi:hypothetical protein BSL78_29080 [Apostichopus japonicus]|uniref:Uncharacterized protein n=1 Tax=Stichopus japonicus TaxID=307972 RepID=A0A2G8JED6_STIJA|nr:hypothetical protein BSL78_29080 [Apostichopus japonicus]